ncbi:MAG: hypothetical protein ACFE95_06900 [Candidatus Hodarchaeota archaeon]
MDLKLKASFLVLSQLFLLILSFICILSLSFTVTAIEVTPNTTVEENDVVILNYTLWVKDEGEWIIDDKQNGTVYVHDPADSQVPNEIFDIYPNITVPPCYGFYEGMKGMRAGDSRTLEIDFNSGKAFNNVSDRLFGEDLVYDIYLQKILLDASEPPVTLFDLPFFIPLSILMVSFVILLIFIRVQRYTRTHNILGLKTRCHSCKGLAEVRCGNSGCNTPYCKSCFVQNKHCMVCQSNTMIPLKSS